MLCRLRRGIAGERDGRDGVVIVLARLSYCGERRGREGVGVAVRDGGGGDFKDDCGWLASGAGISYGSNTALVACKASSVEMTLPLALEAGLVPEFTSTTLFSGLSSSLQIGE